MVLEGESSSGGKVGNGCPGDDGLSVQHHLDGFAPHRDLEMVPFADRPVSPRAWRGGGAKVGRSPRVGPDAVQLARADGPAPDVHLELSVTAQEYAGGRIRQRQAQLLAANVARVGRVQHAV